MGYDISPETHERIERYRGQGRLCQGSSRCSQRGTRIALCLLDPPEWRWSAFVVCGKHAQEMEAWPSFVNGAMLSILPLRPQQDAAALVAVLIEDPITNDNVSEARYRMAVDAIRRRARVGV